MNLAKRSLLACLMAAATLTLSACGGGGGSSGSSNTTDEPVQGLEMPTKLSVVAAQSDTTAKLTVTDALTGAVATVLPAATTDYGQDQTQTWVYDASIEPLSMVNEILCYVGQLRADDMVNQGAYYAMVNANNCQQSGGGGDAGAASSGGVSSQDSSQATKYEKWLVLSSRTDNLSPQEVKIWIPPQGSSTDPMDNQFILVHVTITEGVSATNPFGKFTLNFKGVLPAGTVMPDGSTLPLDMTVMNGTLKSIARSDNKPQFTFINLGGASVNSNLPFDMVQASNVIMDDAAGNSGIAQTYQYDLWDPAQPAEQSKYFVNFNTSAFLRGTDSNNDNTIDTGSQVCADRTQFNTHVWRYNLYDPATGVRTSLNSGMPFTTASGTFGHIGYWGLWLEDETATLNDGDTITRETWGSTATPAAYTVKVSGGKLVRRTKGLVPFADISGVQFQWYGDPADPFCQATTPCQNQSEYAVTIDNSGVATITAAIIWNTNGPTTYDTTDPAVNTTIDVSTAPMGYQLWLWSNSLGGNAIITQNDLINMVFYKEEVVQPDDTGISAGLSLVCYDRCLKGGITTTPASEADLFYPTDGTAYSYTLSVANGRYILTDNNGTSPAEVTIGAGVDLTLGGTVDWYQWGIQNGDMVTAANDPGSANWWTIYEANESYRWETGPNSWNRQYALQDSTGNIMTFQKPLQFAYSYEAGDDPNIPAAQAQHPAGNFHLLEYGGPGELWGFPWTEDTTTGHGYNALTLKNGVTLTDAQGVKYIVKQLEREQTMKQDSNVPSVCDTAGLDLTTAVISPDLALPANTDGEVLFTISDRDSLSPDPAPAVIEGELQ